MIQSPLWSLLSCFVFLLAPLGAEADEPDGVEDPKRSSTASPAVGDGEPFPRSERDPLGVTWLPGGGERTAQTRAGADFRGMGFLFPLRLHLQRGGFIDGKVGGLDQESGELMLILPLTRFRVSASLVSATTPLGTLPDPDSFLAAQMPPSMVSSEAVYKLRPTWRSGVGMVLNSLAPGTGTFIQKEGKALGFLFLGMDIFFLSAGLLAAFAPSRLGNTERAFFAGVFFAFDGVARGAGAAQAYTAGRERTLVPVREPSLGGTPGLNR